MTDVLARNHAYRDHVSGKGAKTLGEALTRMAKLPVAPVPVPPAEPGRRGGAEMGGSYELAPLPKPLPYWWPER
jgi:hypothetical protein